MANIKIPDNHLVLVVLGQDKPGILHELSTHCHNCNCNIIEARVTKLGDEFVSNFLIAGAWSAIAKMEATLPVIEGKMGVTTMVRRTNPIISNEKLITLNAQAISVDKPGLLQEISSFFVSQNINILDCNVERFKSYRTNTTMVNVNLNVFLPAKQSIAEIRESFVDFCDHKNIDAIIEPVKA